MDFLKSLGIHPENPGTFTGSKTIAGSPDWLDSFSPVDGKKIASIAQTTRAGYDEVVSTAAAAFSEWRTWPAPKRGEIVRQIGQSLRDHKPALGRLVSWRWAKACRKGSAKCRK